MRNAITIMTLCVALNVKHTMLSMPTMSIIQPPPPAKTSMYTSTPQIPVILPPPATIPKPMPKGCAPGCNKTELCGELGTQYCKKGRSCYVCIKMSSIRLRP